MVAAVRGGGTGPALDAGERYKKIVADTARLDALLVDLFLDWRGDSGFCRDELLAWCEAQGVEYVLGIAQNPRLKRSLAPEMERARQECERTGQAARVFKTSSTGRWTAGAASGA